MTTQSLSSNVNFFLGLQVQFKVLHWQTKGYARHKAFDDIVETLQGLTDEFVEISMGKQGRFTLDETNKTISLLNLQEVTIVDYLQTIKTRLISLSTELSPEKDTDLLNLRDEMLGSINKLAYLLTLE
jgi:DNA-binding ferritin-like protein